MCIRAVGEALPSGSLVFERRAPPSFPRASDDNWIDDEALEALCPCFSLMPKLTTLHLHNNEITSHGCEFIADNPPVSRLKQLSLWRNHIDGKGFDALGGAIGRGTLKLGMLIIHYNKPSLPAKDRLQDECDAKGVVLSM